MDKKLYSKWKKLVNMTPREIEIFLKSDLGKKAGISRLKARQMSRSDKPLRRGRDSARAIIRMKKKGVRAWNKSDWDWAKRQVSFISRTLGQNQKYFKKTSNKALQPTKTLLNLLIWGHNPFK